MVGMPSAAIASLTMYSRSTGPSAARPSPRRENGVGTRALELDVAAHAVGVDHLAEQDGAAVAELRHEMPELMPGIGHGERLGALRHPVARQCRHAVRRRRAAAGSRPSCARQSVVEPDQPRRRHRRRRQPREEALRQAGVAVVERDQRAGPAWHLSKGFAREGVGHWPHSNSIAHDRLVAKLRGTLAKTTVPRGKISALGKNCRSGGTNCLLSEKYFKFYASEKFRRKKIDRYEILNSARHGACQYYLQAKRLSVSLA